MFPYRVVFFWSFWGFEVIPRDHECVTWPPWMWTRLYEAAKWVCIGHPEHDFNHFSKVLREMLPFWAGRETGKKFCPSIHPSVPLGLVAGPQAPLAGPQAPLAGPQAPLVGTQAPLAGPQAPLAGPQTRLAGLQNPLRHPQAIWQALGADPQTHLVGP